MKRLVTLTGAVAILFITLWFLWFLYQRFVYVITDNAFQSADIVNVSTEDVSGYIVKLYKREFQPVKRGEPLFKVDDSTLKKELSSLQFQISSLEEKKRELEVKLSRLEKQLPASVRAAELQLRAEENRVSALKDQLKETEVLYRTSVSKSSAALRSAKSLLQAAKINLERMENRFNRFKNLYERRVISLQQFEDVESAYYRAKAEYEGALSSYRAALENLKEAESLKFKVSAIKENLSASEKRIGELRQELLSREAALKQIGEIRHSIESLSDKIKSFREKEEKLKILISHTLVRSPISGFVAKKWREEGDFVSPGLTVYSLYSPKTFYVTAWIDEDKLPFVKVGNSAEVELDACGKTFKGKVFQVGKSAGSVFALIPRDTSQGEYTKVTQRVPVKIELSNVPLGCIKPGTNAVVKIRKSR